MNSRGVTDANEVLPTLMTHDSPQRLTRSRNSWSAHASPRRQSKVILGTEIFASERAERRITWSQRWLSVCVFLSVLFYILSFVFASGILAIFCILFVSAAVICISFLYYNNVSIVMVKRLLKEPTVIIILLLGMCNWAIDIARPRYAIGSPIGGFFYLLIIIIHIFRCPCVQNKIFRTWNRHCICCFRCPSYV